MMVKPTGVEPDYGHVWLRQATGGGMKYLICQNCRARVTVPLGEPVRHGASTCAARSASVPYVRELR